MGTPWQLNVTNAPSDAPAAPARLRVQLQTGVPSGMTSRGRRHRVARRTVARIVAALLVIAFAAPAMAQVNPFRVQQRYKEASSGKSIDDFTKRLNDPDPA